MKILAKIFILIKKIYDRVLLIIYKPLLKSCGRNVLFYPSSSSFSYKNIEIGNDVFIGKRAWFSTIKSIKIGNKVMFGPNVTIMGGDHNTSKIGEYMFDVKEKLPINDLPVIIKDDVWIGCNVTILKGVTIGEGSIIAAGSLVVKDISPNSIAAGVPAKVLKNRFTEEELKEHKKQLKSSI